MNNQQLKSKEDVAKQLSISCSQAYALMQEEFSPLVRFGCCVQLRPEKIEFIRTSLTSHEKNTLKAELAVTAASSKDQQENHLIEKEIRHE